MLCTLEKGRMIFGVCSCAHTRVLNHGGAEEYDNDESVFI